MNRFTLLVVAILAVLAVATALSYSGIFPEQQESLPTVTVTKHQIVIVTRIAVGTIYLYGTCTGTYGTLSVSESNVTTWEYSVAVQTANQTQRFRMVTVTTAQTLLPTVADVPSPTSLTTTTIPVTGNASQCPTIA